MIVSNKVAMQRVAQVYQEQKQGGRVSKQGSNLSFTDQVSLSSEGKEMQVTLQKLHNQGPLEISPRAEEIKIAVQQGTYEVSPKQVAAGILQSWLRG